MLEKYVYKKLHSRPSNKLIRCQENKFMLGRGYNVGYGVSIVRPQNPDCACEFQNYWLIIDKASGLSINGKHWKSVKEALDFLNKNGYANDLNERIKQARMTERYGIRCNELIVEKELWKMSGYEVF